MILNNSIVYVGCTAEFAPILAQIATNTQVQTNSTLIAGFIMGANAANLGLLLGSFVTSNMTMTNTTVCVTANYTGYCAGCVITSDSSVTK